VRRPGETDKSWREGGGITCADSDLLVYSLLTLASVPSDRSKYEYAGQPASLWVQNEAICKPTRIKTPEKHFARQNPHILMDHSAQPLSQAHPYWPRPSVPDAGPYFCLPPRPPKGKLSASQRCQGAGRPCGVSPSRARSTLDPCSKTDGPTRASRQQIASC